MSHLEPCHPGIVPPYHPEAFRKDSQGLAQSWLAVKLVGEELCLCARSRGEKRQPLPPTCPDSPSWLP